MADIKLDIGGGVAPINGTVELNIDWAALGGAFANAGSEDQADFLDAMQTGFGDYESTLSELMQMAHIAEAVRADARVALRNWLTRMAEALNSPGESNQQTVVSAAAVRTAAALLGQPVELLRALVLTREEAAKVFSYDTRKAAAAAVLWWKGEAGGLEPGGFFSKLWLAWNSADRENSDRLAVAFPVYAEAIGVYQEEGAEALRKWAGVSNG